MDKFVLFKYKEELDAVGLKLFPVATGTSLATINYKPRTPRNLKDQPTILPLLSSYRYETLLFRIPEPFELEELPSPC